MTKGQFKSICAKYAEIITIPIDRIETCQINGCKYVRMGVVINPLYMKARKHLYDANAFVTVYANEMVMSMVKLDCLLDLEVMTHIRTHNPMNSGGRKRFIDGEDIVTALEHINDVEIHPMYCYRFDQSTMEIIRGFGMAYELLYTKLHTDGVTEIDVANVIDEREGRDDKTFEDVSHELCELYEAKNKAYGNSFADTYQKLGIISAVTRISDKFNRLCNLANNPDIDNLGESLEDTLRDLASYAIMTVVEINKRKSNETNLE